MSENTIYILYICDDDKSITETKQKIEEYAPNFRVLTTKSPLEYLDLIKHGPYHCALISYNTQTFNGYQLAKTIKQMREHMPMILYTDHKEDELNPDIINEFDSYIHKDNNTDEIKTIVDTINELLHERKKLEDS